MERHGTAPRGQLTLAEVVADAARRFGDRAAIVAPDGWSVSYTQLERASNDVASGLVQRGVGPGDVVGLLLPSSPEYLVAYVAAAKIGAVTAGINPRLSPEQRRATLRVAAPSLVIATEDLAVEGAPETAVVELSDSATACLPELRGEPPAVVPRPADDAPVAIVFTSGTTGSPKGAVFCLRQLRAIADLDVGDRHDGGTPMLVSTELVHVGVMTKLPWYLRTGSTLHLLRRWRADDALRVISEQRVTSIGAIAPQIALMLRSPDFDSYDLSAVQTIVAGGAASPPALVAEARERFGATYSIRYSSTESGGVGTATAFDADDSEALHTVGRPRRGVQVRITDNDGAPLPPGEPGTVWLRSAAVMERYWRDPDATATTLVDGWLRSDDLGVVGDDGCLRLVGRRSDTFVRGGYNVHPQTVEAALNLHPGVREAAVIGVADAIMGHIGAAVVVARDGHPPPSLDDLRTFAAHHLAHHELPQRLEIVGELPRTAVDKIDRAALRRLLGP